MLIYVVNAGAKRHHAFMRQHDLRMMHLANDWRYPIEGIPWALDNGAFHAWINDKAFNSEKFISVLKKVDAQTPPDFVICPDLVAQGEESLSFSMKWMEKCPRSDYYLAVQDGVLYQSVKDLLPKFAGIFVGGTLPWKLNTAHRWVELAHKHDKKCHVGRIGTFRRLLAMRQIGVDSVDSSTFAQGPPDMRAFKRIVALNEQPTLDGWF